jgi:hypothetical protein
MLKNIIIKAMKQRNMSPTIGALINAYSSTAILYSPLTLIGVVTTVYGLWGGSVIRQWLPWFETWMLFLMMVVFVMVMMVIFYKVVIPSQYAFTVQQYYKHRNPMVTDINQCLENDKAIIKELTAIKKELADIKSKGAIK